MGCLVVSMCRNGPKFPLRLSSVPRTRLDRVSSLSRNELLKIYGKCRYQLKFWGTMGRNPVYGPREEHHLKHPARQTCELERLHIFNEPNFNCDCHCDSVDCLLSHSDYLYKITLLYSLLMKRRAAKRRTRWGRMYFDMT